ncbi:MAG: biotin/lipoyl-binding protein [Oscillospiraceae bacterium]|nr:biotin/lipoyl-binding protein [Oscillospiraceae bacterium]
MKEKKKKGKKKLIAISVCGVVALAVGAGALHSIAGKDAASAGTLKTAELEKMDLKQTVTLSGVVDSAESASPVSMVNGVKVRSVKVKVGDRVKKGDVIAELDTTDLEKSLASLKTTLEHAVQKNELDLKAAQRGYDQAVAGKQTASERGNRTVSDAQQQYRDAVDDQNQLYSDYDSAAADRSYKEEIAAQAAAEAEAASANALMLASERDAIKKELTAAKADARAAAGTDAAAAADARVADLEAQFETADNAYTEAKQAAADAAAYSGECTQAMLAAVTKETELKMGMSSAEKAVAAAEAESRRASEAKSDADSESDSHVAASKDSLATLQLSSDDSLADLKKQISTLEEQIESCTVKSDIDGIVTEVAVKEGELYAGGVIAVVQDDSSYKLTAYVDQYDISKLKKGQDTDIIVQAVSKDAMEGTLDYIAPTPSAAAETGSDSSSYEINAVLKKNEPDLRIGMTAKLIVNIQEKDQVYAIPESYILKDEDGNAYIEVTPDGNEKEKVPVTCGMQTDYYTEISGSGLKDGLLVVIPDGEAEDGSSLFY